jgi:hypothetical protein
MKILGIVAMGLLLTGCSSFHKEWSTALKTPPPANSIEGAWAGDWRSDKNGHHGSLKCVVTKNADATYRAHFRAHYMKILRYTYVATLNGSESNGVVNLKGESNLGKLAGGVYKYEGTATPTEFKSNYESKYDSGSYEMGRPK